MQDENHERERKADPPVLLPDGTCDAIIGIAEEIESLARYMFFKARSGSISVQDVRSAADRLAWRAGDLLCRIEPGRERAPERIPVDDSVPAPGRTTAEAAAGPETPANGYDPAVVVPALLAWCLAADLMPEKVEIRDGEVILRNVPGTVFRPDGFPWKPDWDLAEKIEPVTFPYLGGMETARRLLAVPDAEGAEAAALREFDGFFPGARLEDVRFVRISSVKKRPAFSVVADARIPFRSVLAWKDAALGALDGADCGETPEERRENANYLAGRLVESDREELGLEKARILLRDRVERLIANGGRPIEILQAHAEIRILDSLAREWRRFMSAPRQDGKILRSFATPYRETPFPAGTPADAIDAWFDDAFWFRFR